MPSGGGRRSSSSSSGSRSLSPYNKRRRGRSAEKTTRKSPPRSRTRKSRSPKRRQKSRSPARKHSPARGGRRSPPPASRGYGGRPGPARRGSPPPARRRSPSPAPRGRKRSPSPPRRRTPSPKRRRSPLPPAERRDRHKTPPPPPPPPVPSRDRRSPVRRDNRPYGGPPPPISRRSRSRSPQHKPSNVDSHQRSYEPPAHRQEQQGGGNSYDQTSHDNQRTQSAYQPPTISSSVHPRAHVTPPPIKSRDSNQRGRSPDRGRDYNRDRSYDRSHDRSHDDRRPMREEKMAVPEPPPFPALGSKDMDYRDKRMGDPALAAKAKAAEKSSSRHDHGSSGDGYNSSKHRSSSRYYEEDNNDSRSSKRAVSPSKDDNKKELGTTDLLVNTRFSELDKTKNFKPKDLITIGIERNIIGDEPAVISPVYKSEHVVIPRKRDEGETPLTTREEFMTRQEEYVERRVIKVVKSAHHDDHDDDTKDTDKFDLNGRENFEVRRDKLPLSKRLGDNPKIEQRVSVRHESIKDSYQSTRHVERRSTERAEAYHRHDRDDRQGDRDERLVQTRGNKRDGRRESPVYDRDERIVSHTRSDSRDEDLRNKSSKSRSSKYEKNPTDLRQKLAQRRGRKDGGGGAGEPIDARAKLERKRSLDGRRPDDGGRRVEARSPRDELPDFSKRPDKGKYQGWEENPEMIPKGANYFEHDNRDDCDYWERRGRGRGWRGRETAPLRGAAFGRGALRGRGAPFRKYEPEWQHDKFEETEQPSSTTK